MKRLLLIGVAAALLPAVEVAGEPAPGATTPGDTAGEEIICKKELEIGSLVRKRKQCHTKAEWAKITESQVRGTRRMADEMMGGMRCDPAMQQC